MSITITKLGTFTLNSIINKLKELNINSEELTLNEIVEKMNYIPDSEDEDKKKEEKKVRVRRAPKVKAKENQNLEMEGEDGNMYKSIEDKNGIWRWKKVESNNEPIENNEDNKKKIIVNESKRQPPIEKAKDYPEEIKCGKDGRDYVSYSNKNGVYKWKLSK